MRCSHRDTITTITAGLAREVCEECARVRFSYVERAVHLRPVLPVAEEIPEIDLELEQVIGEVFAFEAESGTSSASCALSRPCSWSPTV